MAVDLIAGVGSELWLPKSVVALCRSLWVLIHGRLQSFDVVLLLVR